MSWFRHFLKYSHGIIYILQIAVLIFDLGIAFGTTDNTFLELLSLLVSEILLSLHLICCVLWSLCWLVIIVFIFSTFKFWRASRIRFTSLFFICIHSLSCSLQSCGLSTICVLTALQFISLVQAFLLNSILFISLMHLHSDVFLTQRGHV